MLLLPVVLLKSAPKPLAVLLAAGGVADERSKTVGRVAVAGGVAPSASSRGRVAVAGGVEIERSNTVAVLLTPVVLLKSACQPLAVLLKPVVLL